MGEIDKTSDFDYTELTPSELNELYHKIIDAALKNYEYKLHVLRTWKINHEQFHSRAAASIAVRIKKEEEKLKKGKIISEYFDRRWSAMTKEEAERERQIFRDEAKYRNLN